MNDPKEDSKRGPRRHKLDPHTPLTNRQPSFLEPRRTDTPYLYLGGKVHEYLIIQKTKSSVDSMMRDLSMPTTLPVTQRNASEPCVASTEVFPPTTLSSTLHIKPSRSFNSSISMSDKYQGIDVSRRDDDQFLLLGCRSASEIFSNYPGHEEYDDKTSVSTNGNDNKKKSLDPDVDEKLELDEQTELQLKLISVGIFSKIYQHEYNETKAALKVAIGNGSTEMRVNWDLVGTLQDSPRRRLNREVKILKHLQHPNIIRLMAAGNTSDGRRFMITEMLPKGGMLSPKPKLRTIPVWRKLFRRKAGRSDTIKRKMAGMKPRDAAAKVVELAEALGYLHDRALDGKIVAHGNICPDNIGIAEDGKLKIIDFSSCFVRSIGGDELQLDNSRNASGGSFTFEDLLTTSRRLPFSCGALRYMAPEVATGQEPISPASDVYSLGLLIWSLISGVDPYEGTTRSSFYSSVVHYGERPCCSISWPEPLRDIVCLCWSANPESRPNVSTLEMALSKIVLKRKL